MAEATEREIGQEWLEAAAGWRKWGDYIEAAGAGVTGLLIDHAKIGPGSRVVDVGTGHGDPALSIAALVGPTGHVTATDVSPAMIAVARERAEKRGLSNIDFVVADAAELDLSEGSYDAIVSRHTLMFLREPAEALRRFRAFLSPGGRIAAACWGRPDRVPFLSLAFAPVAAALELGPPPPGEPGPMALGAPGALENVFIDGGLAEVEAGTTSSRFEFEGAERFVELMQDCAPQIGQLIAGLPAEAQAKVWRAIGEGVRDLAGDGPIVLDNEVVWAAGSR